MNINDKENLAIKINMLEQENAQLRAENDEYKKLVNEIYSQSHVQLAKDKLNLKAEVEELKKERRDYKHLINGRDVNSYYTENNKLRELVEEFVEIEWDEKLSTSEYTQRLVNATNKAKEVIGE